jgi:trehalose 6-phosphate phosphatase
MTPAARGALPLLSNWNQVAEKIRKHPRGPLVIFLDFDGTLVDIAPRPQMVRLKPAARRILRKLSRHRRVRIVMISGRRRAELLHFIGIRSIRYFGLYGWESGTGALLPSRSTAVLQRALRVLEDRLRPYPTAWIENKKSSLSIHLLDVPAQQQIQIRSKLRAWLKPFRKSLRVEANLRDVEILPRSFQGKGAAVRRLLAEPKLKGALPFYFGDDFSDESGFAAVRRGVSIHVGKPRTTAADFTVRTPAQVAGVLSKLASLLD